MTDIDIFIRDHAMLPADELTAALCDAFPTRDYADLIAAIKRATAAALTQAEQWQAESDKAPLS